MTCLYNYIIFIVWGCVCTISMYSLATTHTWSHGTKVKKICSQIFFYRPIFFFILFIVFLIFSSTTTTRTTTAAATTAATTAATLSSIGPQFFQFCNFTSLHKFCHFSSSTCTNTFDFRFVFGILHIGFCDGVN